LNRIEHLHNLPMSFLELESGRTSPKSSLTDPNSPKSSTSNANILVPLNQKIFIGLGEAVLSTSTLATGFFLNAYFLEVACLQPQDVAAIQIVQGCFDLINDPVVGTLSDHTRSRFGRRRPWMLLGSILLPLSYFLCFSPSPWTSDSLKTLYYLFAFCGISVGVTCMNISVASLVPEMTEGELFSLL